MLLASLLSIARKPLISFLNASHGCHKRSKLGSYANKCMKGASSLIQVGPNQHLNWRNAASDDLRRYTSLPWMERATSPTQPGVPAAHQAREPSYASSRPPSPTAKPYHAGGKRAVTEPLISVPSEAFFPLTASDP